MALFKSRAQLQGAVPRARYVSTTLPIWNAPSNHLQAKKIVSYAESDGDDDEDAFDPAGISTQRRKSKLSKVVDESDDAEDTFIGEVDDAADDDGMSRKLNTRNYTDFIDT